MVGAAIWVKRSHRKRHQEPELIHHPYKSSYPPENSIPEFESEQKEMSPEEERKIILDRLRRTEELRQKFERRKKADD
ncbi:hypothetical protein KUL152_04920 [Tenacibaculum sp. KUL152]|nr:hypothetical protein KUL152_04920 [Tenacibaculum sp. KUL152]